MADAVVATVVCSGAGVVIDPQDLTMLEGEVSEMCTVRLATAPGGSVTVGAAVNTNIAVSRGRRGRCVQRGVTVFSPVAAGYANAVPTFGEVTVGALTFRVNEGPARDVTGGDGSVSYMLEPRPLPAGLIYAAPSDTDWRRRVGSFGARHREETAVRVLVQMTLTDAMPQEGRRWSLR